MYHNNENKQNPCQICTGCGRCGKPASSMQVLDFFAKSRKESRQEQEAGTESGPVPYIIAADIGTTTVAMQLRNTRTGETVDSYTAVNPQREYGLDVLSRIQQVNEHQKKEEMKQAVEKVLKEGIARFRGKCSEISMLVIAANTTMVHLALGMDVSRLGEAPFEAESLEEMRLTIEEIQTVILPGCDAFVGGDIVAGMYACQMNRTDELTLFIDLGTNGELAIGNRERIIATATAAAPAFEGGATAGVYGADMVSVTAKCLEEGIMDDTGLLAEPYFDTGVRTAGITVTQAHIRNIQMAKGAIYAGIQILCREYGLSDYTQIDRVLLAGGFGYYLNPGAAVRIGLVPKELEEKIAPVGNSALEGAFLYGQHLLQEKGRKDARNELEGLRKITTVINLAKQPEFQGCYLNALNFPAE